MTVSNFVYATFGLIGRSPDWVSMGSSPAEIGVYSHSDASESAVIPMVNGGQSGEAKEGEPKVK